MIMLICQLLKALLNSPTKSTCTSAAWKRGRTLFLYRELPFLGPACVCRNSFTEFGRLKSAETWFSFIR